jgi:hypothetical protein
MGVVGVPGLQSQVSLGVKGAGAGAVKMEDGVPATVVPPVVMVVPVAGVPEGVGAPSPGRVPCPGGGAPIVALEGLGVPEERQRKVLDKDFLIDFISLQKIGEKGKAEKSGQASVSVGCVWYVVG